MKEKVFYGSKFNIKSLFITICLLGSLIVVTIIRDNQPKKVIFDLVFYALIIINMLLLIGLYSVYKTRIIIGKHDFYAPFYVWYPKFTYDLKENLIFKTILYKEIESIELMSVSDEGNHKSIEALKVVIKDRYPLCVLLDGYSKLEIQQMLEMINQHI